MKFLQSFYYLFKPHRSPFMCANRYMFLKNNRLDKT